jgi:hypothetical protein
VDRALHRLADFDRVLKATGTEMAGEYMTLAEFSGWEKKVFEFAQFGLDWGRLSGSAMLSLLRSTDERLEEYFHRIHRRHNN